MRFSLPTAAQPSHAPTYLPVMRTRKYPTPTAMSGTPPGLPEAENRALSLEIHARTDENRSRIGGLKYPSCLKSLSFSAIFV